MNNLFIPNNILFPVPHSQNLKAVGFPVLILPAYSFKSFLPCKELSAPCKSEPYKN